VSSATGTSGGFWEQTLSGARAHLHDLSPGKFAVLSILSINASLLLAWRIPSMAIRKFLAKSFLHSAYSGKSYTLLTSAFFHMEVWHFAVNAFAMWGFGDIAHFLVGPEYFAATTVTAAATSSLVHHLWSTVLKARNPGLGASGFVCTFVALTALVFPDAKSLLFFVIPVPMDKMFMGLIAFDSIGLLGVWTMLFGWHIGHAAHLGGVASGWALYHLLNATNRQALRNRIPPELVQFYDRMYRTVFSR
jgi:rhomboid-like protein